MICSIGTCSDYGREDSVRHNPLQALRMNGSAKGIVSSDLLRIFR